MSRSHSPVGPVYRKSSGRQSVEAVAAIRMKIILKLKHSIGMLFALLQSSSEESGPSIEQGRVLRWPVLEEPPQSIKGIACRVVVGASLVKEVELDIERSVVDFLGLHGQRSHELLVVDNVDRRLQVDDRLLPVRALRGRRRRKDDSLCQSYLEPQ